MLILLLLIACETTVVESDTDSGGGDNDSEADTDTDTDTDSGPPVYDLDTIDIGVLDPEGLALGPDGAVYVSDSTLEQIVRVDPDTGATSLYTAEGLIGDAQGLTFLADGRLVVCDRTNDALQVFGADATFEQTVAFAAGMGPNTPAVGPDGLIWVSSRNNSSLSTVDPSDWTVTEQVLVDAELLAPEGIAWLADGNIAVATRSNSLLKVYAVSSGVPVMPGATVLQPPDLDSGEGVDQAPDGTLWISSRDSAEVVHVDLSDSSVIERFALPSGSPMGLVVTPSGAVYAAAADAGQLVRVTPR